jgi:hypothetical protein
MGNTSQGTKLNKTTMKKHNINLDSSSNSSSHGHAPFASGFSFLATSTSFDEWLIDSRASYHMLKPFFLLLMNLTPIKYLLVIVRYLILRD